MKQSSAIRPSITGAIGPVGGYYRTLAYFGAHTVTQTTNKEGATCYVLEGSNLPEKWTDSKYTQFLEFVTRVYADNKDRGLYSVMNATTEGGLWTYIFRWNDEYYSLGHTLGHRKQAIKKIIKDRELTRITLFRLDPTLIPIADACYEARRILTPPAR
jgi:hypothetical protein